MPLYEGDESAGEELLDRARLHRQEGRLAQAVRDLEAYLTRNPRDPGVRAVLADYLWLGGRRREAMQQLAAALQMAPRDVLVNLVAGKIALEDADPERAEEHALTALDVAPNEEHGKRLLALARWRAGDAEGALDVAERAVEHHPRNAAFWTIAGACRRRLGREDARRALEKAVAIDPSEAEAWHELGEMHLEVARFDEAASCFARAARGNPGMERSRRMLARTRYWQQLDADRPQGTGRSVLLTLLAGFLLITSMRLIADLTLRRPVWQGLAGIGLLLSGWLLHRLVRYAQACARARRELA